MSLFAPKHIRKYRRFSNSLFRICPWLWMGGVPAILITSLVFGHESPWVMLACVLTILPALFIWFSVPAVEGAWWILLRTPWGQPAVAWLRFSAMLAVAVAFVALGVAVLVGGIWRLIISNGP